MNKKLWSFNFGCLIAGSFLWLVSFGSQAPVLEMFYEHPHFIINYYPFMVTACAALLLTMSTVGVMAKGFNICTSEHPFWLVVPSLTLLALTAVSAFEFLPQLLYAAVPALIVLAVAVVSCRLSRRRTEEAILAR